MAAVNGNEGKRGAALIVVLWVIGLLAMLTASFAFEAHIESRLTAYYRNRTKAEYLARSGVDLASLLIAKSAEISGTTPDAMREESERWYGDAFVLKQGSRIRIEHEMVVDDVPAGVITLEIDPEPARRNVNLLREQSIENDETWERIFEVGGVPQELWPELIDSFYDWVDEDDTPRIDGAETDDYYANLDEPYQAKNGELDTVGELLLIKGFSRPILEGGTLESDFFERENQRSSGIQDLLTTHGDGKVNINAATARVLQTLPDVDAILAEEIVGYRNEWEQESERIGFESVQEFLSYFPDFPPRARDGLSVESSVFRIKSRGELYGISYTVWCTVRVSDGDITILKWREDD